MSKKKLGKKNPNRKDGRWEYLSKTRKVKAGEIRHHKDGNKLNNAVSNLEVITRALHNKVHDRHGGRKKGS